MCRLLPLAVCLLVGCGQPKPRTGGPPDSGPADSDGGSAADGGASDAGVSDAGARDAGANDAGDLGDGGCLRGAASLLAACLAEDGGPDPCLSRLGAGVRCDSDGDGLSDDLEEALASAYLPVFAFNSGASGGNLETHWPANASHFVSHSRLVYRSGSDLVVDPSPTLAALGDEAFDAGGELRLAQSPDAGGQDFWLCLDDSADATRVTSRDLMLTLPGGVDLVTVAHPANGDLASSSHLFVSFGLFFAYNAHSTVDNHEGDFESVALFVNRQSGAVDAVYFDRHDTTDNTRFIDVATYGAKDPSAESPHGNVSSSDPALHGLRFWDYSLARRHVVAYVATGGHAMYDYPGNTYIVALLVRDTHGGDAEKLFGDALYPGFGGAPSAVLAGGLGHRNPGEAQRITLPWARYRGQWGCDDGLIGKSWPVPFGNSRHARPLFERAWGSPPGP